MKTIVTTRQFRKDIKKYLGQPEKVKKLYDVVNLLNQIQHCHRNTNHIFLQENILVLWNATLKAIYC